MAPSAMPNLRRRKVVDRLAANRPAPSTTASSASRCLPTLRLSFGLSYNNCNSVAPGACEFSCQCLGYVYSIDRI